MQCEIEADEIKSELLDKTNSSSTELVKYPFLWGF